MNKIKLLKQLSIISPNWASKIRKYYKEKELQEAANNTCRTKDDKLISLKDYRSCVVGEAFSFPQFWFNQERAELLYASCKTCKYYSEHIYINLHSGNESSFWALINNFVKHFKATHLGRYETKLMLVYIEKLEEALKQKEKEIEVIQ